MNKKDQNKEEKIYTRDELEKKLTNKERIFCHQVIIDWNGARAARVAGYSENSIYEIAHSNMRKAHIQQYIDFIKIDLEKESGITKLRQLNELAKLAYSSIAHLHETWIELKEFENLTDEQKEAIESIETKTETIQRYDWEEDKKVPIDVKYVKLKLHSKTQAIAEINKMMGYNEPDKIDLSSQDGSMSPKIELNWGDVKINLKGK